MIAPALLGKGPVSPPWPMLLLDRFPILRRLPARLLAMGVRPEHVKTKAV